MFGVYEIQDTVGQGGMGVVYRAHDTALDRVVALKVLKEDLRSNKQVAARFQREAQAIASLSHPGIVHIYAVGSVGRIPFISMEFIEGLTLSQLMKRERRIEWKRALHIAEQIAEALACAHDAHIIHRDIKPGNVLLGADDRAYVTDFGIAKVLTAETQLTVEGSRLGTPNYMSPERCMNKEITPSSDLYSLGIVLFQMICGRMPYEAASPVDLIRKIVTEPPARLSDYAPDVPGDVERLVAHLIEKKPADRPRKATDVARMCRRVMEGEPLFEESAVTSSLRSLRDSEPSTSTGTTGLSDFPHRRGPIAALRQVWAGASVTARLWTAGIVLIVAAGALGQLAAVQSTEGLAPEIVHQWDRTDSGWMRSASAAEFAPESAGVNLVRVNLPRMGTTRILAAGGSDFAVEFSGPSARDGEEARAIGEIVVEPPTMRLVMPPRTVPSGAGLVRLVGSERGASPAFPNSLTVFVSDGERSIGGGWSPELRAVDASMVSKDYGHVLMDAEALPPAERGERRTLELVEVSPFGHALAVVIGDGTAEGYRVFLTALDQGQVSGTPSAIGGPGGEVRGVRFTPGGGLLVARDAPGAGLTIRQYADGGDLLRFSTADATATLGDLSHEAALIVTGTIDDRAAEWIDLATGDIEPLGSAVAAALHADGAGAIVTARDYRGNAQVYTCRFDTPDDRTQLTFLAHGVGQNLCVSRDGRYALADLPDAGSPGLVLITIEQAAAAAAGAR